MKLINLYEELTSEIKNRRIFAYKLQDAFIEIGGKNTKIKFSENKDIVSADCVVKLNEYIIPIKYHYDIVLDNTKIHGNSVSISFESEESDEPESYLKEYNFDIEEHVLVENLKKDLKSHLEYFYNTIENHISVCDLTKQDLEEFLANWNKSGVSLLYGIVSQSNLSNVIPLIKLAFDRIS